MKKIVICCDGTWNTPDEIVEGRPAPTNVTRVAKSIEPFDDDGNVQIVYYDTGVGTSGSWLKKCVDGFTGAGLSQNIIEAYLYLCKIFNIEDEIYLFGFSRGAYTVRSLSGMIRKCGILKKEFINKIDDAYSLYRTRHEALHPNKIESTLFRKSYANQDITPIKFIGVWDTVGALGNPLWITGRVSKMFSFHDTDLSSYIENAYHALAIDEHRKAFSATLWKRQINSSPNLKQTLQQVWFSGVHSDVGGGYSDNGLAGVPLKWMANKAISCGLKIDVSELFKFASPAMPCGPMHDSRTYIEKICGDYIRPITFDYLTNEYVHESVKTRMSEDSSYLPQNLTNASDIKYVT